MSCPEAKEKRMDPQGVGGTGSLKRKRLSAPSREKAKEKRNRGECPFSD
jgi:hypothetical protein